MGAHKANLGEGNGEGDLNVRLAELGFQFYHL